MDVVVLVPAKPLPAAKSRLRAEIGERISGLALAMAVDTVRAAVGCSAVTEVVVITNDRTIAAATRAAGAAITPDRPERGLNEALRRAAASARRRMPDACVISQPADCPCVTSDDFFDLITMLQGSTARHFVRDAAGPGTTALASAGGCELDPRYGPDSAAAHRASGARELIGPRWRRLRRDVDTAADLESAKRLGLGASTAAWLMQP